MKIFAKESLRIAHPKRGVKSVWWIIWVLVLTTSFSPIKVSAEELELDEAFMTIQALMDVKVVTASRREQDISKAASNMTIVTGEMIEQRGYKNLVEILEDVAGFDFATYEDGGGEYPIHSVNRGIGGDPGNTKLLVMVDGIVQNHISFNWSTGWTNEQMFHDVDRIEIVQGPGSALYGSNAYSGIVHIITKRDYEGLYVKPWAGSGAAKGLDLMYGGKQGEYRYQLAMRGWSSDGDGGDGRPDPGGYFHDNVEPNLLTQGYDSSGNYQTDFANPEAGKSLPDGFNTSKEDRTLRFKVARSETEVGLFYWDKRDGLGSYVTGFEYGTADPDFIVHHSGYDIYGKNRHEISPGKISLNSTLWYRLYRQQPDTGFEYAYRFDGLRKSYNSDSVQTGIEEQINYLFGGDKHLVAGARYIVNGKMDQVISLGSEQSAGSTSTTSSWDLANAGSGLGKSKSYETHTENEQALYALLEGSAHSKANYSIGGRYDKGSDYGSTLNPRAGLVLLPDEMLNVKLLYGTAFKQPSLFELKDEFRGSDDLVPEKIETYELEGSLRIAESGSQLFEDTHIKMNIFFSRLTDNIMTVADSTRAGGERYDNVGEFHVRGISLKLDTQILHNLIFDINYIYTEGCEGDMEWQELDHVAKNKVNAGVNWQAFNSRINFNFRVNHVGERKVPVSNSYFDGYAPAYTKANLALTLKKMFGMKDLEPQLIVKNLFDAEYFGVGRQVGSSDISSFDPDTNPNPAGFIPPYHPQPGRTLFINVKYEY